MRLMVKCVRPSAAAVAGVGLWCILCGVSCGEGVAGTGTGPAGSADIDSGSPAASTLGLTGAGEEGGISKGK